MSKENFSLYKLAPGTIVNQRYEILDLLGAGGFGNTYLARDRRFSTTTVHVCVKEFFLNGVAMRATDGRTVMISDPTKVENYEDLRRRFRREAERMFTLRDEHIVRVSDLFDENNTSYYVMDYVAGLSLAQLVQQNGPASERLALQYTLQLLKGLRVIHKVGMVHLDIKPGNVMIDKTGKVVLIDFGASKIIENGSATLSAAMLNTPGYAPLEQALCQLERIGEWTDLYAVGGTLYKILTGSTPAKAQEIIDEGEDAFQFPDNISEPTRQLIYWMMNKRISERPHTTEEVIKRVEAIIKGESAPQPAAAPASTPTPAPAPAPQAPQAPQPAAPEQAPAQAPAAEVPPQQPAPLFTASKAKEAPAEAKPAPAAKEQPMVQAVEAIEEPMEAHTVYGGKPQPQSKPQPAAPQQPAPQPAQPQPASAPSAPAQQGDAAGQGQSPWQNIPTPPPSAAASGQPKPAAPQQPMPYGNNTPAAVAGAAAAQYATPAAPQQPTAPQQPASPYGQGVQTPPPPPSAGRSQAAPYGTPPRGYAQQMPADDETQMQLTPNATPAATPMAQPQAPVNPFAKPEKKKGGIWKILLIVLAVLVVAAGIAFVVFKFVLNSSSDVWSEYYDSDTSVESTQ